MLMKPLLNVLLAGLVWTGTAFAQSEQWLEYHTGLEAPTCHLLKVTTNAPPGVALPALNGRPYFGRWITPMDPAGGRWLCLDRTRKNGPYDRLFIDSRGDGRLDDKPPVLASLQSFLASFPPTPVVFKGEDGPVTDHLLFRFYSYDTMQVAPGQPAIPPELLVYAAGWYEGRVNFDGVKKRVQLFDGNVNGTFNDMGLSPAESDRIQIEGDKTGERFLGRMVEVDGKLFQIEVARDGAYVKVRKAENVTLGRVSVPENISEVATFGENGYFVRQPVKGELTLPAGQYRVVTWMINRKDEKGVPWTLTASDSAPSAGFTVAADQPAVLDIGEPIRSELTAAESADRQVTFSLKFTGRQQEAIQMLRDGQTPAGPKLVLANADGTQCYTNSFEFG